VQGRSLGAGRQHPVRRAARWTRHAGNAVGHVSPEAAGGGTIALVKDGDRITIDIPRRAIRLDITDDELARRRAAMDARGAKAWQPEHRDRRVSTALQAYAALTTSAARGAVREVSRRQSWP
jgi:dihydroxy-acid dehydratase